MEQWRDIPGYEGLYQASDCGNIRTREGKTTSNVLYARRVWKQRVLKQKYAKRHAGKHKDARVCLWKDGKESTWLVSRLVALAWCDGYCDGMTVNHIDGNPMNNHADNLEWVSAGDNIRKAFEDGLMGNTQKSVSLVDADGNRHDFRSMACASRFLGKCNGYISNLIARGYTATPDGYTIIVA